MQFQEKHYLDHVLPPNTEYEKRPVNYETHNFNPSIAPSVRQNYETHVLPHARDNYSMHELPNPNMIQPVS